MWGGKAREASEYMGGLEVLGELISMFPNMRRVLALYNITLSHTLACGYENMSTNYDQEFGKNTWSRRICNRKQNRSNKCLFMKK